MCDFGVFMNQTLWASFNDALEWILYFRSVQVLFQLYSTRGTCAPCVVYVRFFLIPWWLILKIDVLYVLSSAGFCLSNYYLRDAVDRIKRFSFRPFWISFLKNQFRYQLALLLALLWLNHRARICRLTYRFHSLGSGFSETGFPSLPYLTWALLVPAAARTIVPSNILVHFLFLLFQFPRYRLMPSA